LPGSVSSPPPKLAATSGVAAGPTIPAAESLVVSPKDVTWVSVPELFHTPTKMFSPPYEVSASPLSDKVAPKLPAISIDPLDPAVSASTADCEDASPARLYNSSPLVATWSNNIPALALAKVAVPVEPGDPKLTVPA